MKYPSPILGLLCLAGLLVGCSDGRYPNMGSVSGTVTVDGEPLPNAEVVFLPLEGQRVAIGRTNSRGHYELMYSSTMDGAVAGRYRVTISKLISSTEEPTADNPYAGAVQREQIFAVESVEVATGSNTHDFDVPPGNAPRS